MPNSKPYFITKYEYFRLRINVKIEENIEVQEDTVKVQEEALPKELGFNVYQPMYHAN